MAIAPSAFALPSSGGTVSPATKAEIAYVNDTWVAANINVVRYATDPSGAWSTATALPAAPTGYNYSAVLGAPLYVDGNYVVAYAFQKSGALAFNSYRYRIYYTSSLSGSWTEVDPGVNDYCFWQWFTYLNGEFVLSGMDLYTVSASNPWPWIMATASTVTGSWSKTTGSTSGLSGITQDRIPCVIFDNGTYYRILERGPSNPGGGSNPFTAWVQYATSITGTWTSSTALPYEYTQGQVVKVGSQIIVPSLDGSLDYSSDLTGSWSSATLPSGLTSATGVAYAAPWYVVIGSNGSSAAKVAYGKSLASLSLASSDLSTSAGYRGNYGANYFVVGSTSGRLNYSYATGDSAPSLLRQRQSPKRTPSRVRGVDLRQRQTPYIR